jgi:hypothetical protein
MANETGQSSAAMGLGALETFAANRPYGPIMSLDAQSMSTAPESNVPQAGGFLGGHATPGSAISVPVPSIAVQAPTVTPIPPGLICAPNTCWYWGYSPGFGVGDHYNYQIRMAFYPDTTCQVVFVIQHVYAANCTLTSAWDYLGTFVVQGQQLVFSLHGQRSDRDQCNPSNNGQWPIGGTLTCGWSLNQGILTIDLPFTFGPGPWRIFKLAKVSF